ncbi:MAG: glutamine-hydrolyzing GMP synthase [Deltaproteobacteria bacterium]|nr:glutamine-hydrolyzing GMP synthase [Candidatus Anaeroferrophillus wilburensis]MBN2889338.1 glutamine-hydrolyzing GMP synthase [Deltaproteobacteria bacterium]
MQPDLHAEKILILDFGSQYSQLIARRIRESKVYCEIHPFHISLKQVQDFAPQGIILSGGPASTYGDDAPHSEAELLSLGIPVLGICYGMQEMVSQLGGLVEKTQQREYGKAELGLVTHDLLFEGLAFPQQVWMSHGDKVSRLPSGFTVIGETNNAPIAAISNVSRRLWGVQFHPEVIHTPNGRQILDNFVFSICGCHGWWTMQSFIDSSIAEVRQRVGKERVILGLSGGVDSSVVALLLHRAIGDQLICIFVNNGVLRRDEAAEVQELFRGKFKLNLHYVDASEQFLDRLAGVTDPEEKRKIIGNEFIRVFEDEAAKLGEIRFLAQGTLYPDVIESVSFKGPSAVIKSHHNVGGLPERMKMALIEPLRELFKDEGREVGRELGLPVKMINRQPFPGPGLAIRIIGAVTPERLTILREADAVVLDEIVKAGLYNDVWQSFAVLVPVKTVGVMGDERTYEQVIAIRAVTSIDGMTADWARLPHDLLEKISNRIINEVHGVNRVVYDISSKPPGTIEWE